MRVTGSCHVYFAVDLGFAIDLVAAERLLAGGSAKLKKPRRAPDAAQLARRSGRFTQQGEAVEVGSGFTTQAATEVTLWEFGAAVIGYRIALEHALDELVPLSDLLWDNAALLADAQRRAAALSSAIRPAIDKPSLGAPLEDYVAFALTLPAGTAPSALWTTHGATSASILRAEPAALSDEEVADALAMRCSYLPGDVVIVDWFAALLVGEDVTDELLVLELTTAELLELRHLDAQLDVSIEAAYALLPSQRGLLASLRTRGEDLARVSRLQADAAVLFEGVDNALKLLGDQYLARLYRVAGARFHLAQWDAAIERKLRVLDGIYEKLSGQAVSRRLEVLELVIVVLIALSSVLPFLPGLLP